MPNFDASSLTEDDALSINEAFRDAGFKTGDELRSIIEEASFDAKEISSLAPPPPQGPPPLEDDAPAEVNKDVNSELLEIFKSYDLNTITPVRHS